MSNVDRVQEIYAAFGRGDIPYILDQIADDVSWDEEVPGYGVAYLEPGSGRDHVAKFFAGADALVFDRFEPLNFLAGGDQVAAIIRVGARNAATSRRIDDYEVHVWTFGADGRVTRFAHVVDRHAHVSAWRDEDP